eukprot:NODE_870_length_3391_cov_0.839915.p2 type:complete len:329 gc:universal NODE_870_length_3391_cov_0.839915:1002-16(-)
MRPRTSIRTRYCSLNIFSRFCLSEFLRFVWGFVNLIFSCHLLFKFKRRQAALKDFIVCKIIVRQISPIFDMLVKYLRELKKISSLHTYNLSDILERNQDGVYTTCRVFGQKIFKFSEHIERLKNGSKSLGLDLKDSELAILRDIIRDNISIFDRITIILSHSEIIASFSNVIAPPKSVAVKLIEGHRDNPNVKSVEWVNQRKVMESHLSEEINEVILVMNGNCYEGLSSNFFVGINQGIQTAPLEVILPGTVQKLVCENFTVEYQFPQITQIYQWDFAMISSTSRLVLPVHRVYFEDSSYKDFNVNAAKINKIVEKVNSLVNQNCEYP